MYLNSRSRKRKRVLLVFVSSILAATLFANTSCSTAPTKTTWPYREFIQAVEQDQVKSININADRSQATITTQDGETALVNLPNDPGLIDFLQKNKVDIAVAPQISEDRGDTYVSIFTALAMPTIALVGLLGSLFWVWMLIDCATQEPNQGYPKIAWILIILFTNFMGALIYFFVRRSERRRHLGE